MYTVTSQSACTGSPCGGRCLRLQGQGEGVFCSEGEEASTESGVGEGVALLLLCDWLIQIFEFSGDSKSRRTILNKAASVAHK